jgi:hypothetical protein
MHPAKVSGVKKMPVNGNELLIEIGISEVFA